MSGKLYYVNLLNETNENRRRINELRFGRGLTRNYQKPQNLPKSQLNQSNETFWRDIWG